MKKIWKWLLFVLVILLAAGCVFLYRYINRIRYNDGYVNGNTAGNLYNEGYFCEKDGIVYFANPAEQLLSVLHEPGRHKHQKVRGSECQLHQRG